MPVEISAWLDSLARPSVAFELAALAACIGLAWLAARTARGGWAAQMRDGSVWFGERIVDGVLFPVLALIFTLGARWALKSQQPVALLNLAVPILASLVVFIVGKMIFFSIAFVIPMFFCSWWMVLLFYTMVTITPGIVLSVVFQLAHCDEQAQFPLPVGDTGRMEHAWAIHQVETTVDFAQRSKVLTWLLGGLNYQIEHHLFPKICHTNYPAISKIVQQVCREFNLRYNAHTTFFSALKAHYHWLRQMGQPQLVMVRA